MPDGAPLIALTLRYDRLDNFWFTLCHELAHVALHFDGEAVAFFDDLDQGEVDALETEADRWASDALIPSEEWRAAGLGHNPSAERVRVFAAALRINPVIPFGRIQKETGDYKRFGKIVTRHKVRQFWT
jgi:HTH-type transcriptional regulator/antitoxin HigA